MYLYICHSLIKKTIYPKKNNMLKLMYFIETNHQTHCVHPIVRLMQHKKKSS